MAMGGRRRYVKQALMGVVANHLARSAAHPLMIVAAALMAACATTGTLGPAPSPETRTLLAANSSVRWHGRLVVAEHRRIEGGAEDGDRRATLHELTIGAEGASRSRPLLPGEIEADYQLSPDATQIAFRPTAGRHV